MTTAPTYAIDPALDRIESCVTHWATDAMVCASCLIHPRDLPELIEELTEADRIDKRMNNGRREIRRKDTP